MSVFYAFCRVVDDIVDASDRSKEEKLRELEVWRREIKQCYSGEPVLPLAKELAWVVRRYLIQPSYLEEIVNGMAMDLEKTRYETWEELRQYCYRVASCVGLVSIEIFGYQRPASRQYAELLGLAFQTTNILRDVRTDWNSGRIYLPVEDFKKIGAQIEKFEEGNIDEKIKHVFRLMAERAEHFYKAAERALPAEDRSNMLAAQIMGSVYHAMLEEIKKRDFDVWSGAVKLPKWKKLWLMKTTIRQERRRRSLPSSKKVVVIGGGFAGLTTAVELGRAGHEVTLLESRQTLGGRTHSFREPKTGDMVDNGQHILMGCYHETLEWLASLGSTFLLKRAKDLEVGYVSEDKGYSHLAAWPLPAPLHLAGAIAGFKELNGVDKWKALQMGFFLRCSSKIEKEKNLTVQQWLETCGQTKNVIRALWEPLCLAALNEPIHTASAVLFAEVIQRTFFGSRKDSSIILSRVGLSDLFVRQTQGVIEACNGKICVGSAVKEMEIKSNLIQSVTCTNGACYEADVFISAVPWYALQSFLPKDSQLAAKTAQIQGAPIIGIHLWFDREVCDDQFFGFLDSPIHWVFNHRRICDLQTHSHFCLSLVISGAYEWLDKKNDELLATALNECHRLLPRTRPAVLVHHLIYRARDATFQARPETLKLRPGTQTEWTNFLLAGDWTDTGLPATIEGAVMSGKKAARLIEQI